MSVFKLEYAGMSSNYQRCDTLLNKESYQIVPSMMPFKVKQERNKIEIKFSAVFDWADAG
jgi:hypothetical protein